MQFNYLFEKGAFILHPDETFGVDFEKVRDHENRYFIVHLILSLKSLFASIQRLKIVLRA